MERIIGLDFGTHQTKICVKTIEDEGHGLSSYEFFEFETKDDKTTYALPSIIQKKRDGTLSYGIHIVEQFGETYLERLTDDLYDKYSTKDDTLEDKKILKEMLQKKYALEEEKNVFRYFKQATFSEREWGKDIDCNLLSVLYISYILFLLEERYGQDFSINFGIPSDESNYKERKELAVRILLTAYDLVENIYQNDKELFLSEKLSVLKNKIKIRDYSEIDKNEYFIKVFPESYAGLIALTHRGKIPKGMNLFVDIGGGTTDISFFTIKNKMPDVHKYWSIPKGLNFLAEKSGFDYLKDYGIFDFKKNVINLFNESIGDVVDKLTWEMKGRWKNKTGRPSKYLSLDSRPLVYGGGGCQYEFLLKRHTPFDDVKKISKNIWKEVDIVQKQSVEKMCHILFVAYGLTEVVDDEISFTSYVDIIPNITRDESNDPIYIDKDMC